MVKMCRFPGCISYVGEQEHCAIHQAALKPFDAGLHCARCKGTGFLPGEKGALGPCVECAGTGLCDHKVRPQSRYGTTRKRERVSDRPLIRMTE